jgi:hypothetical protein
MSRVVDAILHVRDDQELGFRRPRRAWIEPEDIPSLPRIAPGPRIMEPTPFARTPNRQLALPTTSAGNSVNDLLLLDEWSAMLRRDLLSCAFSAGALVHLESYLSTMDSDPSAKIAVLRATVTAQRRREGSIPAAELAGVVVEHLRLLRDIGSASKDNAVRREASEALSEGFGFLAWLAWDMWEIGSAQRYYRTAVRLARESQHPTLPAYMLGSIAAFAAQTGSVHRGLLFLEKARHSLPSRRHATVDAWLNSTAAVTHAAAGHTELTWRHLGLAEEATVRASSGEHPPWPWVMRFDEAKLAGYRIAAAVRLGRPDTALELLPAATTAAARAHTAQYALMLLNEAEAHGLKSEYEQCAQVAIRALEVAAAKTSYRVLRAAWQARHVIPVHVTSQAVKDLDSKLRDLDPVDI